MIVTDFVKVAVPNAVLWVPVAVIVMVFVCDCGARVGIVTSCVGCDAVNDTVVGGTMTVESLLARRSVAAPRRLSWNVIDDAAPAVTLAGDAVIVAMEIGCISIVALRATPLSVAVTVPWRAVGTSAMVTLNDPLEPVTDAVGGHVRPSPVHVIVTV